MRKKQDKRKIPYQNSPHKTKVPDCYEKNCELWELRIKKEDKKLQKKEEDFIIWYKNELKRKGYKVSKDIGKNNMIKKEPYKNYVLDPNNLPVHGLRVSFPTKSGIRKVREEASKRGIRNIKSTYYGHYVSVVPPNLINEEMVKWLNTHEAVRENLPIPIDQLYIPEKKPEPIKVDMNKWASWAKKL